MSALFVQPGVSRALESDEFEEVFDEAAIGIELEDVSEASQQAVKRVLSLRSPFRTRYSVSAFVSNHNGAPHAKENTPPDAAMQLIMAAVAALCAC